MLFLAEFVGPHLEAGAALAGDREAEVTFTARGTQRFEADEAVQALAELKNLEPSLQLIHADPAVSVRISVPLVPEAQETYRTSSQSM